MGIFCGSVTTITRNCVHRSSFHQTGFVCKGSDHLQLIKFWPSRAPVKGVCDGAKMFGSALLQPACSVCVCPSAFSFIMIFLHILTRNCSSMSQQHNLLTIQTLDQNVIFIQHSLIRLHLGASMHAAVKGYAHCWVHTEELKVFSAMMLFSLLLWKLHRWFSPILNTDS